MIPTCERTKQFFSPLENAFTEDAIIDLELQSDGDSFVLDHYLVQGNYRFKSLGATKDFIKRLPESKSINQTGKMDPYRVPVTDVTCELINKLVPPQNICWSDERAQQLFNIVLGKSIAQDHIALTISDFKLNKVLPAHNYELCDDKPLKPYQQIGLYGVMHSDGFGLFMEMGTGKTPVGIAAICNLALQHREKQIARGEIISPLRICIVVPNQVRLNWYEEFFSFATQPGKVTVMRGTAIDRVKQLIEALKVPSEGDCLYTAIVVGYKTLWRSWEAIGKIPWDVSILDEAHEIRNSKAKQSQMALELRDISARRIVMTGTPWANSVVDYYMLLEFIAKGNSGFSSLKAFRKFYTTYEEIHGANGQVFIKETGTQNLPFLQERLMRCSYFISLREALPDLPPIVYDVVEVEMTPRQEEMYRKVQRDLAIQIENTQNNSNMTRQMMISCILTQLLRLNQITSGFISWDEITDINGDVLQPAHIEWIDSVNPKAEALADKLYGLPANEKTVIWANWIPDIQYIMGVAEQLGIKAVMYCSSLQDDEQKEAAKNAFNYDREVQWLVGTQGSGGAGMNLLGFPPSLAAEYDTNCTREIYYSQDWSQIKRTQSEKRAHRNGTRCQVHVTDLVVPGSIDEEIRDRVLSKKIGGLEVSDLTNIMQRLTKEYKLL